MADRAIVSGICGIVTFSDEREPLRQVEAMNAAQEHRGPDGTRTWIGRGVALGHALLATTPEAARERLPLEHPSSGCTITGDVRLDNRDELLSDLGLADRAESIGDAELALMAYLRWDTDCPTRLLGDFAFAVWDSRKSRLFCARDHLGMRQILYYAGSDGIMVFATEAASVLQHSQVPRRINEGRIVDFLEDYLEGIDFTSTFFQGIERLPPAHAITFDARGANVWRYWSLEPGDEIRLRDDGEYAEAFREVFSRSVRSRLRSTGPVGVALSGGLDSGSVAAMGARLLLDEGRGPLRSFSGTGPDPHTCRETRMIGISSGIAGLQPTLIRYDRLEPYIDDLVEQAGTIAEPFDGSMTIIRTAYLAARRAGVRVMLDGAGADVVLTEGSVMGRLLRSGRIREFWHEALGLESFWEGSWSRWDAMLPAVKYAFVPDWMRHMRNLVRDRLDRRPARALVSPAMAAHVDLGSRVRRFRSQSSWRRLPARVERMQAIRHPFLAVGRERYDRVAAAAGVEPRDPFLDLRLVRFCTGLPDNQVQRGGWSKMVLRNAMSGMVPEDVRMRRGKTHLGGDFTMALVEIGLGGWAQIENEINGSHGDSGGLLTNLARHWQSAQLGTQEVMDAWFLVRWLQRNCSPDDS